MPNYSKLNPYQNLLLKNLADVGFDVRYGMRKVYFSFIDLSILFNLIKNYKVDIIHLHWQHPFIIHKKRKILAIFKCLLFIVQLSFIKFLGVKIVWTVHNLKNHDNKFIRIEKKFTRIVALLADAIIAHCRTSRLEIIELFKINKDKVFVIPHGNYHKVYKDKLTRQESRKKFNLVDTDFTYLFLGLIRPYKGIVDLIESFQNINDPSVKLIIAGRLESKELGDVLKKKEAFNNHIMSKFHYIDDDEIEIYMKASDVMVLPYRDIINSGSAILGMSFGKAIIAPYLGCIPELLNNEGGILYDPNDKNGLLKAMKLALASKNKIVQMGEANFELAKKMDWKDVATSTGKVYSKCRGK